MMVIAKSIDLNSMQIYFQSESIIKQIVIPKIECPVSNNNNLNERLSQRNEIPKVEKVNPIPAARPYLIARNKESEPVA